MAITGAIYFTGAISVLAVGLYFKWASSAGAFAALLGGLIAVLGLSPIQKVLGFKIEPTHLGLTTVSISFATMLFDDTRQKGQKRRNLMFWEYFWKFILIAVSLAFLALTIWVGYGGFFELREIIKNLNKKKN